MEKNYLAALEIGPISSNIIVTSYVDDKLYLVAKESLDTPYFENGQITDKEALVSCLHEMKNNINNRYKIDVDKIILVLPNNGHKMYQASVSNTILTEKQIIGKHQIDAIRQKMLKSKVNDEEVVVLEVPKFYILSDERVLRTPPINYQSPTLSIKSNIHTLPINIVKDIIEVVTEAGFEIIGKYPQSMCNAMSCVDEFELEDNNIIISFNQDNITITPYAKQIQLKASYVIKFGFNNLVKALAETLHIDNKYARELIESYFILDIDKASNIIIDKKKEISPKRISGILLNRLTNVVSDLKEDIDRLASDCSFDEYKVLVIGKFNDFDFFNEFVNKNLEREVNARILDIIGLDSQKYIGTYGAIKLYAKENKDNLIKKIQTDYQDEIEIKEDKTQNDNNNSSSRFRDIFNEE